MREDFLMPPINLLWYLNQYVYYWWFPFYSRLVEWEAMWARMYPRSTQPPQSLAYDRGIHSGWQRPPGRPSKGVLHNIGVEADLQCSFGLITGPPWVRLNCYTHLSSMYVSIIKQYAKRLWYVEKSTPCISACLKVSIELKMWSWHLIEIL